MLDGENCQNPLLRGRYRGTNLSQNIVGIRIRQSWVIARLLDVMGPGKHGILFLL